MISPKKKTYFHFRFQNFLNNLVSLLTLLCDLLILVDPRSRSVRLDPRVGCGEIVLVWSLTVVRSYWCVYWDARVRQTFLAI